MTADRQVIDRRERIDVQALLVWTYRRQRADVVIGSGAGLLDAEAAADEVERHGISGCGCAAVASIERLGCRVDGGGMSAGALHPDAETVHQAVQKLPVPAAQMVMRCARWGDVPDWMPRGRPIARAVRNGRGQAVVRCEAWDRHRHYGWCPIEWVVSVARIEAARREYAIWHSAIRDVAYRLIYENRLTAYRVCPPAVRARPWEHAEKVDIAHPS